MAVPRALAVLLLFTALALAGCSSKTPSNPHTVTVSDFKFSPQTITVDKGTVVTFHNTGGAIHTGTSDNGGIAFDSGDIAPGATADVHLDAPGVYTYHCRYHSQMTATIVVNN